MYAYGNTRLRAVKSRLMSRDEIESLARAENMQALINTLLKSNYRSALERALSRRDGLRAVKLAMQMAISELLEKLRRYYDGKARERIGVMLRRYDVDNVKTILRGLDKRLPAGEIGQALHASGELDRRLLTQIAGADHPRAAIDMMASMQLSIADALIVKRVERPGAALFELELALERWYLQESARELEHAGGEDRVFVETLRISADLDNLMTALRFAHSPEQRQFPSEQLGLEISDLFLDFGNLPASSLESAANQDSVERSIQVLDAARYEEALSEGLAAYRRSGRLSEIERALRKHRLVWQRKQILTHPLGIGVPLGVLALKANEAANIRWIAWGLDSGFESGDIMRDLVFAS